jgi:hypothetical protein
MSGSCGCKSKGKNHVHKKPGDGTLYTEMGSAFWET